MTTTVWAIADLHLNMARGESREAYAGRWRDHAAKLEREWRAVVGPRDLVLIPGDVSTARNHREIQPDLAWLDRLPGLKVFAPGNHDGWWNGVAKVRPILRKSIQAVGGDAVEVAGAIVCGTLGSPPDLEGASRDREIEALDRALIHARQLQGEGQAPIFALWHYPPFDRSGRPGPAVALLEAAGVTACVYGHLHAQGQWGTAAQGLIGTVRYHCVAADAVGFRPLKIAPGPTYLS